MIALPAGRASAGGRGLGPKPDPQGGRSQLQPAIVEAAICAPALIYTGQVFGDGAGDGLTRVRFVVAESGARVDLETEDASVGCNLQIYASEGETQPSGQVDAHLGQLIR